MSSENYLKEICVDYFKEQSSFKYFCWGVFDLEIIPKSSDHFRVVGKKRLHPLSGDTSNAGRLHLIRQSVLVLGAAVYL